MTAHVTHDENGLLALLRAYASKDATKRPSPFIDSHTAATFESAATVMASIVEERDRYRDALIDIADHTGKIERQELCEIAVEALRGPKV